MALTDFETRLLAEFSFRAHLELAQSQSAYMRHQFEFIGLKAADRRAVVNPLMAEANRPPAQEWRKVVKRLWVFPQRDYQYVAQELAEKYAKNFAREDIALFQFMVTNKSWWDTVDFIATHLIGNYFKSFPEQIPATIDKWLASGNIWLQRSALLFQLKYKAATDQELLGEIIRTLATSKEFFIRKAIGWALREYSKTDPDWVIKFVRNTELSGLSEREALRRCIRSH